MEVYRSTDNVKFTKIYTTGSSYYTDTTAEVDTVYYYKVRTYKYSGSKKVYSKYSNVVRKYIEEGSGKIILEDGTIAYKNDTFEVGTDIEPGIYKVTPRYEGTYVKRLNELALEDDDVIASKYFDSYTELFYIEIKDTDKAVYIEEGSLEKVDMTEIDKRLELTPGIYFIGKDADLGYYYDASFDTVTYYQLVYSLDMTEENDISGSYSPLTRELFKIEDNVVAMIVEDGALTKSIYDEQIDDDKITKINPGTYIIGEEVTIGTYKLSPESWGYMSYVIKDIHGNVLEENSYISGNYLLTIPENAYEISFSAGTLQKLSK